MRKVFIFVLIIFFLTLLYIGYLYIDGESNVSSFKSNLDSETVNLLNEKKDKVVEKVYEMAKTYDFILNREDIEVKKGIANRGTLISETFLKRAFPNQKSKYIKITVKFKIPLFIFEKSEKISVSFAKPIIESPHKKEIDREMKHLPIFGN